MSIHKTINAEYRTRKLAALFELAIFVGCIEPLING